MPTDFQEKIYIFLRQVPKGKITTYKALAKAANTQAFRAVGTALNKNPYAPQTPCHRVINSDGKLGGFAHGPKAKIQRLKSEGVEVKEGKIINFKKVLFTNFSRKK